MGLIAAAVILVVGLQVCAADAGATGGGIVSADAAMTDASRSAPSEPGERIPPESLSPWSAAEAEIERLVARGELPFEARSFRPVVRGELAAWLRAGARGSALHAESGASRLMNEQSGSPARELLLDLLRWDLGWLKPDSAGARIEQMSTPAPAEPFASPRPGAWVRLGARDRLLLLSPYLRVMPRFTQGRRTDWTDSTRVGFRATFFGGRSVVIQSGFYAAEVDHGRGFADPLVAGTDLILHADEATLSARWEALTLRLGRDRHQWAMGASGTLLLAESSAPFDFVEHEIRLGERVRFQALTGMTDRNAALGTPGSNPGAHRFLSAHRLLWTLTSDLALGLSEGARYQADAPGVLYLAGILPYTLVERLQMQDEPSDSTENFLRNNVLWSVDVSWRARAGLLLYAELLADDIATQSSAMPTRGGVQLGLTYAPRWRGWDWTLGAEYTRVSDYTYSVYYQDLCRCDWEHQGQPLGYALGPDSELMLLRAGLAPTRRLSFSTWVQHLRRGDGAIGRPWRPAEADCACDDTDAWSFDDSARAWTIGGEARYRPRVLIWAGAAVEHVARSGGGDAGESEDWTSETRLRLMLSAGM